MALGSIGSLFAQRAVQVIGAGLLSGAVGGTALVATGIVPIGGRTQAAPTLNLLACPGSGPVLGRASAGQSLLVVGRSADGGWLEVYVGEPGLDRAWAPATNLKLQAAADTLPVAACVPPATSTPAPVGSPPPTTTPTATAVVTIPPSAGPSASTTAPPSTAPAPSAVTTPKPTGTPTPSPSATHTPPPTPTHTPTPPPTPSDTTKPVLSNLAASMYCIASGGSSVISVTVTDPDDSISSVSIGVVPTGSGSYVDSLSYAGSNVWHVTIVGNQPFAGWSDGDVKYTVTAHDSHGNSASVSSKAYPDPSYLYYMHDGCIV